MVNSCFRRHAAEGSSGECSLVRTLQKLAGGTHIHHDVLQLRPAGVITLMELPDVLESTDQQLVLADGPNNHSAGISVVTEARATHESQVLLPIDINTEAREAISPEQCDPEDHSQSSNFCII